MSKSSLIDWAPPEVTLPVGSVTHPTDTNVKVERNPKKGWVFSIPPNLIMQASTLVQALLPGVVVPAVKGGGKKPAEVIIPLLAGDGAYEYHKTVKFAAAVMEEGSPAQRAVIEAFNKVGTPIAEKAIDIVLGAGPPFTKYDTRAAMEAILKAASDHGQAGAEFAILCFTLLRRLRKPLGEAMVAAEEAKAKAAAAEATASSLVGKLSASERRVNQLAEALLALQSQVASIRPAADAPPDTSKSAGPDSQNAETQQLETDGQAHAEGDEPVEAAQILGEDAPSSASPPDASKGGIEPLDLGDELRDLEEEAGDPTPQPAADSSPPSTSALSPRGSLLDDDEVRDPDDSGEHIGLADDDDEKR